jgi:hypothetical protein
MLCDFAVTIGNQGLNVDAVNNVISTVGRRLQGPGRTVEAVLAVAGSAQEPGLVGSIEADDPEDAAKQIGDLARRTLYQLGQAGWNIFSGAWPHEAPPR